MSAVLRARRVAVRAARRAGRPPASWQTGGWPGTINRSRQLPSQHLEAVAEATIDAECRRDFVTRMHHAMLAARVLAVAIFVPVGVVHEIAETLVMLVGDEIT